MKFERTVSDEPRMSCGAITASPAAGVPSPFVSSQSTRPACEAVSDQMAAPRQVGGEACGSSDGQIATGRWRLIASERARLREVRRSFADPVIRLFRTNSRKLGAAIPRMVPATINVIMSSSRVKPFWVLFRPMA